MHYDRLCQFKLLTTFTLEDLHMCVLIQIIIGYWLDVEIYVRVLLRSNIARRQNEYIIYISIFNQ